MDVRYNNKGQPFIIKSIEVRNKRGYACVEFLDTGTIEEFRIDVLNKGEMKDRYAKDVLGVACIGRAKKVGNEREYGIWSNMISRCYDKNDKSYVNYGENGVTVGKNWLCFEEFLIDLKLVEGYDDNLFQKGLLQLDKDIKQLSVKNKVYSLETCKFVSREENMKIRDVSNLSRIRTIGYKPNSDEPVYISNISQFAKDNKMSNSGIYECLSGIKNSHNGWRFEKWE